MAPRSVQNEHRAVGCGRRISLLQHLQHFGTNRQQSEHRKKAKYRMPDDPERLEVPMEAKNEDRGTCGYIAALAWPGSLCDGQNSEIVPA